MGPPGLHQSICTASPGSGLSERSGTQGFKNDKSLPYRELPKPQGYLQKGRKEFGSSARPNKMTDKDALRGVRVAGNNRDLDPTTNGACKVIAEDDDKKVRWRHPCPSFHKVPQIIFFNLPFGTKCRERERERIPPLPQFQFHPSPLYCSPIRSK